MRTLNPGYFALVMATGIVSVAMSNHGAHALSVALLWLACLAFVVLAVATAARIIAFRADFAADLRDPRRAFGSFTFVAAADVLGTRLA
ncbi:MAG: tellurite resistance/C4-dicarboxylate transporter family protein, partial [Mycobacterium sp.]